MKQKHLYLLIFGIIGILLIPITYVILSFIMIFGGGIFWMLIFGGSNWPFYAWPIIFGIHFFILCLILMTILNAIYSMGKDSEDLPINKLHIFILLIFSIFIFSVLSYIEVWIV